MPDVWNTVDLQGKPVDFHILGTKTNPDVNNNWRSQGVYVNDDGTTLNLDGNWNRYDISVNGQYQTANPDAFPTITLQLKNTVASTKKDQQQPLCNALNQNDYINKLFIYNAAALKMNTNYDVNGVQADGSKVAIGSASYNGDNDRIEFSRGDGINVCMSVYPQIVFTPKTA